MPSTGPIPSLAFEKSFHVASPIPSNDPVSPLPPPSSLPRLSPPREGTRWPEKRRESEFEIEALTVIATRSDRISDPFSSFSSTKVTIEVRIW
ncbi:hypothetical protein BHM03_00052386 [Ensete ventricosum]|nr:hypothetical protein BHM03_00052386 [Ensete ventricosum]